MAGQTPDQGPIDFHKLVPRLLVGTVLEPAIQARTSLRILGHALTPTPDDTPVGPDFDANPQRADPYTLLRTKRSGIRHGTDLSDVYARSIHRATIAIVSTVERR